jgi:hypothetical protein
VIVAGNRGTGGRRYALPAFFVLTSIVAIALVMALATDDPRIPGADTAAALPAVSVSPAIPAPLENETPRASRERERQLVLEIERALVSNKPQERDKAIYFSLPELLDSNPARVIELVAHQDGETRDALRDEVVRLWIRKDREAAMIWMGSFENEAERKASATIAMRTLAAIEPAQAIAVADEFGVGRDDGSLEHIVQIWATEDFDECTKWLETQPDNPRTAQMRTRVEQVREQRLTASQ